MRDHPLGFAQFGAGNTTGPIGQFDVGYSRGFVCLAVGRHSLPLSRQYAAMCCTLDSKRSRSSSSTGVSKSSMAWPGVGSFTA